MIPPFLYCYYMQNISAWAWELTVYMCYSFLWILSQLQSSLVIVPLKSFFFFYDDSPKRWSWNMYAYTSSLCSQIHMGYMPLWTGICFNSIIHSSNANERRRRKKMCVSFIAIIQVHATMYSYVCVSEMCLLTRVQEYDSCSVWV